MKPSMAANEDFFSKGSDYIPGVLHVLNMKMISQPIYEVSLGIL